MLALGIPEHSRVKRRQAHDTALHQKDSVNSGLHQHAGAGKISGTPNRAVVIT
jgi:hypothetical protein